MSATLSEYMLMAAWINAKVGFGVVGLMLVVFAMILLEFRPSPARSGP
jgi:hypothetical protein